MGCPGGKFYEYTPVNSNTEKNDHGYLVKINDSLEYYISAGLNYSFIKSIESGISVSFYSDDINKISELENLNFNIYSKKFGTLSRINQTEITTFMLQNQTEKFVIFGLDLSKKIISKNRKLNDTIYIELNNQNILTLVK